MVRLRVKEVMEQKHISMGKLSRLSDVSLNTVRRICNDPSYVSTLNTLERIAKALNVTIADLYEEMPDNTDKQE